MLCFSKSYKQLPGWLLWYRYNHFTLGKICVQITRAPVGIKFIQNTLSFIWNPKIENKIEVDAPNTDDMKKKNWKTKPKQTRRKREKHRDSASLSLKSASLSTS